MATSNTSEEQHNAEVKLQTKINALYEVCKNQIDRGSTEVVLSTAVTGDIGQEGINEIAQILSCLTGENISATYDNDAGVVKFVPPKLEDFNFPFSIHAPEYMPKVTPVPSSVRKPNTKIAQSRAKNVPRPQNCFLLFRNDYAPKVKAANPGIRNNAISKVLGKLWRAASPGTKAHYSRLSNAAKIKHAKDHPGWVFKPRKSSDVKRRGRKVAVPSGLVPQFEKTQDDSSITHTYKPGQIGHFDQMLQKQTSSTSTAEETSLLKLHDGHGFVNWQTDNLNPASLNNVSDEQMRGLFEEFFEFNASLPQLKGFTADETFMKNLQTFLKNDEKVQIFSDLDEFLRMMQKLELFPKMKRYLQNFIPIEPCTSVQPSVQALEQYQSNVDRMNIDLIDGEMAQLEGRNSTSENPAANMQPAVMDPQNFTGPNTQNNVANNYLPQMYSWRSIAEDMRHTCLVDNVGQDYLPSSALTGIESDHEHEDLAAQVASLSTSDETPLFDVGNFLSTEQDEQLQ